jgi:hypothetical protein
MIFFNADWPRSQLSSGFVLLVIQNVEKNINPRTDFGKTNTFWDVTLCGWASKSRRFEALYCLHNQRQAVQDKYLSSWTSCPLTLHTHVHLITKLARVRKRECFFRN